MRYVTHNQNSNVDINVIHSSPAPFSG